eukprot:1701057-Amphidinium_carterae.1
MSTASASKWTEAYVWVSTEDASIFVLGNLRPSKVTQGATAASTYWHLHRDPVFALTSAYYHQSMAPDHGKLPAAPAAAEGASAASGQPAAEEVKYIKWCLVNLIINQETLDSMDDAQASNEHMQKHHWYPSKYIRRFTDYSIEIIVDPAETPATINISDFVK